MEKTYVKVIEKENENMDYRLFLVPVGMVIVAVIVLLFLKKKAKNTQNMHRRT